MAASLKLLLIRSKAHVLLYF